MDGSWENPAPGRNKPCGLPSPRSTASFWHKEPSPLLIGHRSTRNLPTDADVVIVGSGMTGTSVAYHLLKQQNCRSSLKVVLLEAREACWGATGRNGGHCQPILFAHPDDPAIGEFELNNFHTIQRLVDEKAIDCEFVVQPGVQAVYSRGKLNDIELDLLRIKDIAPAQAARMRLTTDRDELSALRVPTALGAVITNVAARMWPYKFVSHMLEELLTAHPSALNGTFNLQTLTPVTSIDGTTVTTNRGSITARNIVLATNAYTSHLLPNFASLIVPCKGTMSALNPFPSLSGNSRIATSLGFAAEGTDDYLIQRPNQSGGHLMFGGGRQTGPSLGITDDSVVDDAVAHYLRTRLVEVMQLPEQQAQEKRDEHIPNSRAAKETRGEMHATHIWTGIMGYSRDDKPWVGSVPGRDGVFVAAGFTGHGMPNTWLCGKAVALMVEKSLAEESAYDALEDVVAQTGMPRSYIVSKERIEAAMTLDCVQSRDWAEMERGKRAERRASGYA